MSDSTLIDNIVRFQKAAFDGTEFDSTLSPPATETEIGQAEADLGFSLPRELKEIYRFCSGELPLGPGAWLRPSMLAEQTEGLSYAFDDHVPNPEYVSVCSLNEGPGSRPVVVVQSLGAVDVIVEADGEEPGGAVHPGRVWSYHVHSIDEPWHLAGDSLGEYWERLAVLAEAGWFRGRSMPNGLLQVEAVENCEESPAYQAELAKLELSHYLQFP